MKTPSTMLALFALAVMACAPALANDKCLARIDASEATGNGLDNLAATLCDAPTGILLESAVIKDTFFASNGDSLLLRVAAEEITEGEMYALSAKLVDIEFRAGSIIAFSNATLRDKIEQYMAETYTALFGEKSPLRRVRIAALYPMSDGTMGVVYGTVIWNDEGWYGPGNLPLAWETWRLHRELKE